MGCAGQHQNIRVYRERRELYKRYARIIVDGNDITQEILAAAIAARLGI